jgi:hypothetical protein
MAATRAASLSAFHSKPSKLLDGHRTVLVGKLLDLGRDLVGRALLVPEPGRLPPCRSDLINLISLIFGVHFFQFFITKVVVEHGGPAIRLGIRCIRDRQPKRPVGDRPTRGIKARPCLLHALAKSPHYGACMARAGSPSKHLSRRVPGLG